MEPIILASSSPRRQDILKDLGIPFQVIMPEIDETVPADMELSKVAEYFASKKVETVIRNLPAGQVIPWVLGADTLIIHNNKIYGKPADRNEAVAFLKTFSGQTQEVVSAIALFNGKLNYLSTRVNRTMVTFGNMTDEEIEWYVESGEWHGAAGGYRIQGLGSCFIKHIEGSQSSVIGLPIFELYDILREQGYSLLN